ncbi:hypothetical protein [Vibrio lentus]|uniref:hypothetical protein n=1 Tax=Vibrio lentus TaxID=136468 RepID=UPI000C81F568|nr:hypothetical protein [Vibrio lentus]PMM19294.1 hypothetical protein BCT58_20205 [Vibrio lentus]
MKKVIRLLWCLTGFSPILVHSATLDLGVNIFENSVEIKDASGAKVAEMAEGVQFFPKVSLTSEPVYLFGSNTWSYTIENSLNYFKISEQEIANSGTEFDLGTSVRGWAVSSSPMLFYRFPNLGGWEFKSGISLGLGYIKLKGNYQVTNPSSPELGQIKDIDEEGVAWFTGFRFDAKYGRHIFSISALTPTVQSSDVDFRHGIATLSYSYSLFAF